VPKLPSLIIPTVSEVVKSGNIDEHNNDPIVSGIYKDLIVSGIYKDPIVSGIYKDLIVSGIYKDLVFTKI